MTVERMSWDDYFLGVASAVAARADCQRSRVGAVAVRDTRIIATGYNGTDAGSLLSCLAGHCPRVTEAPAPYAPYDSCISTHAEINCIRFALATYGADTKFDLYVTRSPCDGCMTTIHNTAGIERVAWPEGGFIR